MSYAQLIGKYKQGDKHSKFMLDLAYAYMAKGYHRSGKPQLSPYENDGIKVVERYISINQKNRNYERAAFGNRLIATRYIRMGEYKKGLRYLVEALKVCNKNGLENEKIKSFGGLHSMLSKMKYHKSRVGISQVKKWKEGFSLKGLNKLDIERIDDILSTF